MLRGTVLQSTVVPMENHPSETARSHNVWIGSIDSCGYMNLAADAVDGRGNIVRLLRQGLLAIQEYRERIGNLLGSPLPSVRAPGNSADRIVLLTAGITRVCAGHLLPSMLRNDDYQPLALGVEGSAHGITSSFDYFFPDAERKMAEAVEHGRTLQDDTRQNVSQLLAYFTVSALCSAKPLQDFLPIVQRTLFVIGIHDPCAAQAMAEECNRSLATLSGECTDRQLARMTTPMRLPVPEFQGTMR